MVCGSGFGSVWGVGRGSWVTDLGFVCVMGFGCYNGGAVTCHGGTVTCGAVVGCGCYNGGYGKWSGGGRGGWLLAIVLYGVVLLLF